MAIILDTGQVVDADVLIDCTNTKRSTPYGPSLVYRGIRPAQPSVFRVGPGANDGVPAAARPIVDALGVDNTVGLWPLIPVTELRAGQAARKALSNLRRQ